MKKHLCPYLDSQDNCTHKTFENTKKLPKCRYSNPFKCRYYNLWIDKTKKEKNLLESKITHIKENIKEYQKRWIK